jgi:hypothetical protein
MFGRCMWRWLLIHLINETLFEASAGRATGLLCNLHSFLAVTDDSSSQASEPAQLSQIESCTEHLNCLCKCCQVR